MEGTEGEAKGKNTSGQRSSEKKRCSGLAVEVKDGMLAFINLRRGWR